MDRITELARLSVLRASGFAGIAIMMVIMGSLGDPPAAFRYGAGCLLVLSASMGVYGYRYPRRRRIEETEVWIMLGAEERPEKQVARQLIIVAMRDQLLEKSLIWASVALLFLGISFLLSILLPFVFVPPS